MTEPISDEALARALVWRAWREMNAIRAETGAPIGYDGMLRCTLEHWDALTNDLRAAVGDDALPWEPQAAKALRERCEREAEQRSADEIGALKEMLTAAEGERDRLRKALSDLLDARAGSRVAARAALSPEPHGGAA